ncbi:glucose 1-dehydrogenase [Paraburkholderia sp. Ac-20336]|uniref:glucose 1-dehydrogenase n=1 Tax=Burkholderiaceae TaxID=119060 RepID=UPI0014233591|nr:glucose 1-dehydrogenase [Paraburkholderia sp. Ac-20336]NIF54186.1 glucose 1-dehydrogenase [Burkholderia sp. Ax-1724]NIF77704.1 glucose 1-dehydrogenase [Paraburkholderia sp. Cy-641]
MSFASLQGKVVIVTGAGSGIGAATARRLAEDGARVVVVDVERALAQEVAASLPEPGNALAVQADVSREEDVERYMRETLDRFGRVDLHHLNAGIVGTLALFPDIGVDEFDAVMRVNLRGPFLGARAAFRQYAVQQGTGSIVITASIGALLGSDDLLPYQTSKHGVLGIVHGGAMYGGPRGIRVNAVAPGLVPTALFAANAAGSGAGGDVVQRGTTVPMRRVGTPDEVANAVAFLLSDESSYINGDVLSVDGGSAIVSTVRPSGGAGQWNTAGVDGRV